MANLLATVFCLAGGSWALRFWVGSAGPLPSGRYPVIFLAAVYLGPPLIAAAIAGGLGFFIGQLIDDAMHRARVRRREVQSSRPAPSAPAAPVPKPVSSSPYQQASQKNDEGVALLSDGDATGAEQRFTEAIRSDPSMALAYKNRAIVRKQLADVQGALADIEECVRLDARDSSAYKIRADIHDDMGAREKALSDYGRALQLDPRNGNALINRAYTLIQLGRWDDAQTDVDAALQIDPASAAALKNRNAVWDHKGVGDAALADIEARISSEPDGIAPLRERGRLWSARREYRRAVADFTSAIAKAPGLQELYRSRGHSYYWLQEYAKAQADYAKAVELGPPSYFDQYMSALIAEVVGKKSDAIAHFRRALELNPDHLESHNALKRLGAATS